MVFVGFCSPKCSFFSLHRPHHFGFFFAPFRAPPMPLSELVSGADDFDGSWHRLDASEDESPWDQDDEASDDDQADADEPRRSPPTTRTLAILLANYAVESAIVNDARCREPCRGHFVLDKPASKYSTRQRSALPPARLVTRYEVDKRALLNTECHYLEGLADGSLDENEQQNLQSRIRDQRESVVNSYYDMRDFYNANLQRKLPYKSRTRKFKNVGEAEQHFMTKACFFSHFGCTPASAQTLAQFCFPGSYKVPDVGTLESEFMMLVILGRLRCKDTLDHVSHMFGMDPKNLGKVILFARGQFLARFDHLVDATKSCPRF